MACHSWGGSSRGIGDLGVVVMYQNQNVSPENVQNRRVDVEETALPLVASERTWNRWDLTVVLVVAASATWCYVIGAYVGYYLNLKMGIAAMTAGSMIGMLLVTLAVVPIATKFGIDSIKGAIPQFGNRGWVITVVLQYVSIIGWNSILLIFFAKSVRELAVTLGFVTQDGSSWLVPVSTVIGCGIVFMVLRQGSRGIEKVSKSLFFVIVGLGLWMVYELLTRQGAALAVAEPQYASESRLWNYTTGIEIGIVSLLSWWPYIGAMVRVGRNAHKATLPAMVGMGLPVPVLSVIGLAAILALGATDPTAWLVQLGGPLYGAIALLFVIAANFGTAIIGVYASSLGIKQVPGIKTLSWRWTVLISLLPVALVGAVIPHLFFASFGSFLALIGVFFAPLCAIQITDYFILRQKHVSVRAIYDASRASDYAYWGGFNVAALAAMAVGFCTYIYLLHPITYSSHWPYQYIGAALPTAFVSGVIYYAVTKLVVQPARKGGYENKADAPNSLRARK